MTENPFPYFREYPMERLSEDLSRELAFDLVGFFAMIRWECWMRLGIKNPHEILPKIWHCDPLVFAAKWQAIEHLMVQAKNPLNETVWFERSVLRELETHDFRKFTSARNGRRRASKHEANPVVEVEANPEAKVEPIVELSRAGALTRADSEYDSDSSIFSSNGKGSAEGKGEEPPKAKRRKPEVRSLPKWESYWFEIFWSVWPGTGSRAEAVREWDKLKPEDSDVHAMMAHIRWAQDNDEQWREPRFIGHACRFLKYRKWDSKKPLTSGKRVAGFVASGPKSETLSDEAKAEEAKDEIAF